jgi:uracil-DNA glycosylase family 4
MAASGKPKRQVKQRLDSLKTAGVEYVANPPEKPVRVSGALFDSVDPVPAGTDRRHELTVLATEVAGCPRCSELYATRTQTVFGVGPLDPDICFVGEAPGAEEDRTGEPFVGAAGQLLNKIITASGFKREEVYICNTIKCRPPNNREPSPEEKANCRPYFDRQLDLVKPKYIVCLGGVAAKSVLNTQIGITKLRGKFHDLRGIPVLCTFHPAYLLRNPAAKKDCWDDMKMLLTKMGRPIPGK